MSEKFPNKRFKIKTTTQWSGTQSLIKKKNLRFECEKFEVLSMKNEVLTLIELSKEG